MRVPRRSGQESAPTEAGLAGVAGASSTRVVGERPELLGRRHEGDAISGRGGQSGLVGLPGLDGLGALPRRGGEEQCLFFRVYQNVSGFYLFSVQNNKDSDSLRCIRCTIYGYYAQKQQQY